MADFGKLGAAFVEIEADLRKLSDSLKGAQPELQKIGTEIGKQLDDAIAKGLTLKTTEQKFKDLGSKLQNVGDIGNRIGRGLTVGITAPLLGLGAAAFKFGTDFEDSFTGVVKTVDATEAQLASLREEILELSTRVPASAAAIADVAAAAGQLGIQTENILGFTEVMIGLGEATNLTATEAATAFAQFDNITGGTQQNFEELASVIVDLGNNLATTEADILNMGLRLAGAGRQVGLTQAEILGLAGALASVGLEADSGGSSFDRVMRRMQTAVQTGSDQLETFSAIAGTDFAEAWGQDAAGAINLFIAGLARASESGVALQPILEELQLSELRVTDALTRTGNAYERVAGATDRARRAAEENIAFQEEVDRAYEKTSSVLETLRDSFVVAFVDVFEAIKPIIMEDVVPALNAAADVAQFLAEKFKELPEPVRKVGVAAAGAAAILGPMVLIGSSVASNLGLLVLALGKSELAMGLVGKALPAISTGFRGLVGLLAGPVGLAAAVLGLGIGLGVLLQKFDTTRDAVNRFSEAVRNMIKARTGGLIDIDAMSRGLLDFIGVTDSASDLAKQLGKDIDQLQGNAKDLGIEMERGANESLEEYRLRLSRAITETVRNREEIAATTPVIEENTDAVEEDALAAQQAALAATQAAEAKAAFREKVQGLKDELLGIKRPTDEFVAAIHELDDQGLITADVLRTIGGDLQAMSETTDPLIMRLRELAPLLDIPAPSISLKELNDALRGTQKEADLAVAMLEALHDIPAPPKIDAADLPMISTRKVVDAATDSFEEAEGTIRATEESIIALRQAGFSTDQIIAALGGQIREAKTAAEQWGLGIGEATHAILEHQDEAERSRETAKKWQNVWTQAVGRVVDDFASGVADMIIDFKDFSFNLTSIAKDLGKALIKILITDTFTKIASKLGGLLSGISGGGIFGSLGRAIGGALGGTAASTLPAVVPGLGAAVGGTAAVGAGATAAGAGAAGAGGAAAAGGAGGGLLGLGAATIPVFGAIAAGAILAMTKIGQGRKTADEFVQGVQNPFNAALAEIVDTKDAALAAGTLTAEGAVDAKQAVEALWATFNEQASAFADQGGTQEKVVGQAFQTLDPLIDRILMDIGEQAKFLNSGQLDDLREMREQGQESDGPSTDTEAVVSSMSAAFNRFDAGVSGLSGRLDSLTGSLTAISDRVEDLSSLAGAEFNYQPTLNLNNEFTFTEEVDPITVRDRIVPEITTLLQTAGRGLLDEWARMLRDAEDGLAGAPIA